MRLRPYLLTLFTLLPCAAPAAAPPWSLDRAHSSITFTFSQEGKRFAGNFERFDLEMRFSPEELQSSHFVAIIDVASLNTQSDDRDLLLRSEEFFDVAQWPRAEFRTDRIEQVGDNRYIARAHLTIRDTSQAVDFPFSAIISGPPDAIFSGSGELQLRRSDYGLARGDWADTRTIGATVNIRVTIRALAAAGP